MSERVYVALTSREYADAYGVSMRTARRRVAETSGAVRTGRGWRAPILASDYAKASGKSARTVRRHGFRATPERLSDAMAGLFSPPLRQRALDHFASLVGVDPGYSITARYDQATGAQLRAILALDGSKLSGEWFREEWDVQVSLGAGVAATESLLFYHD